jgi:hypothetical protein
MIYYKGLFFQVAKVGRVGGNVKKNGVIKKNAMQAMILIAGIKPGQSEKDKFIHI